MNIIFVVGVVLVALIAASFLRQVSSPLTTVLLLAAVALLLSAVLPRVGDLLDAVSRLAGGAGVESDTLSPVFRGLGIVLITRFASDVCLDNGQRALADAVEYCGQIFVVCLALPLILDLAQKILDSDFMN